MNNKPLYERADDPVTVKELIKILQSVEDQNKEVIMYNNEGPGDHSILSIDVTPDGVFLEHIS